MGIFGSVTTLFSSFGSVTLKYFVHSVPKIIGHASSFFLAAFLILVCPASSSFASSLTPEEEQGKQIYMKGRSPSGKPIIAYFGRDLLEMPGERATCSGCHGYDGLGRPESGVIPTNITWPYLMKAYGHIHPGGLEHPAFTEESLKSYLKNRIYPGGKKGDPSMPIYDMDDNDLEALLSYLRRLGTDFDPGLSENSIRIGMVLPSEGPEGEIGEIIEKTVRAHFEEINLSGGIYGRRVELTVDRVSKKDMSESGLRSIVQQRQPFALVSTFTPGLDAEMARAAEIEKVPLIGPFALFPADPLLLYRYTFYVFPGLLQQAEALIEHARRHLVLKEPAVAIILPRGKDAVLSSDTVAEMFRAKGYKNILRTDYEPSRIDAAETVRNFRDRETGMVFFLGGDSDAEAFLKEVARSVWRPYILFPGILLGSAVSAIPPELSGRVFISFPALPDDRKEWAIREMSSMSKKYGLPGGHPAAQISALVAAKVLAEGIRLSGQQLSHEKFLAALEGLREFGTGLTPSVTYGRNRRIGILGAYVIAVDPERPGGNGFITSREWISLE